MTRNKRLLAAFLGLAFVGAVQSQTFHEAFQNVLVRGLLFVGTGTPTVTQTQGAVYASGTLEVDGATRFDGTVTTNSTTTIAGNLVVTPAGFEVTYADGATTVNVTSLQLGSANYGVMLEPTAGVTVMGISSKDANGFYVDYQTTGTTTGRGLIVHY